MPVGHSDGRIRVIVRLKQPPLAAVFGRSAKSAADHRLERRLRLVARLPGPVDPAQNAAAAQLSAPSQRSGSSSASSPDRRITASVPPRAARARPARLRQQGLPEPDYTLNTNESPSIISADALHARTGAMGDGVKIAVVDNGIDQTNPFLRPDGMHFPPGFPKGGKKWTTPKVIVVRAFPGPNSGREGRIGGDPAFPHGTHVSGIAAGRRHDRAAELGASAGQRPERRRPQRVARRLPRVHHPDAARVRARTRRRSSRRSRPRYATGWT